MDARALDDRADVPAAAVDIGAAERSTHRGGAAVHAEDARGRLSMIFAETMPHENDSRRVNTKI